MGYDISRRSFLAGAAVLAAGAALGLPCRAFADDPQATDGAIVILHTNDVHCAVGEPDASGAVPLGYSALASYAADRRKVFGSGNVTLVDAGDAVQGKVMGTLTQGQALIDIMNECGYEYAIPGNHEFDFGMTQFNRLVASAKAKYLSCNFTDLRTGSPTLMFAPYAVHTYTSEQGLSTKVAFVGVTTPATLTASTPRSFWRSEEDHTRVYGFCEDETGDALVSAVQNAIDEARAEGADYVVLLAHMGQSGEQTKWRSATLASRCRNIDVIIDGHSHEEYVQVKQDADGRDVIITQTGTQFSSVGQIVLNPVTGSIAASTPHCEAVLLREARKADDPEYVESATFGRDRDIQRVVNQKIAEVEAQTGTVVGQNEVDLFAYESDGYTWAVRAHETNLGDFVTDAYLYCALNNGVDADVAFVNGGGIRSNLAKGDITRGGLIDVNPFNNQLCYTQVLGQDLLDALEVSVSSIPEPAGDFLQVSEGFSFAVRTDIESPVCGSGSVVSIDVSAERRVRRVTLHGKAIDPAATYTLVCHSYYLVDGGGRYSMLSKNPVTLMGLDNEALMEYLQVNLKGVIGQEYAGATGQGRIAFQVGPDPVKPDPEPEPEPKHDPESPSDSESDSGESEGVASTPSRLAETGDNAAFGVATAVASSAAVIGAAALAAQSE